MMTNINYSFLSSSSVRELARHNGSIDGLVPDCIKDKIMDKFKNPGRDKYGNAFNS